MIPATNELRRTLGLPTVPTLTGRRRASRVRRKQWQTEFAEVRFGMWVGRATRATMGSHRNLEACPDHLLGEPDAEQRGRMVRMEQAVLLGWIQGMTHSAKREET